MMSEPRSSPRQPRDRGRRRSPHDLRRAPDDGFDDEGRVDAEDGPNPGELTHHRLKVFHVPREHAHQVVGLAGDLEAIGDFLHLGDLGLEARDLRLRLLVERDRDQRLDGARQAPLIEHGGIAEDVAGVLQSAYTPQGRRQRQTDGLGEITPGNPAANGQDPQNLLVEGIRQVAFAHL